MNIIAMTTLAPAILETSLFQLCDELSNSWWHRMLLGVLGLASHALDGPTTSERIAYRRNPLQPSPCRLTPQFNGGAPTYVTWHFISHRPLQLLVCSVSGTHRDKLGPMGYS